MKKISKEMETSCKALGAAMFMATVLIYMGIGALYAQIYGGHFYYHIPFAFLIQAFIVAMIGSVVWVLSFKLGSHGFAARYLLALVITLAMFGISLLIPIINGTPGHFLWLISGIFSILAFGTPLAALSEKAFKATGERPLWISGVINASQPSHKEEEK